MMILLKMHFIDLSFITNRCIYPLKLRFQKHKRCPFKEKIIKYVKLLLNIHIHL